MTMTTCFALQLLTIPYGYFVSKPHWYVFIIYNSSDRNDPGTSRSQLPAAFKRKNSEKANSWSCRTELLEHFNVDLIRSFQEIFVNPQGELGGSFSNVMIHRRCCISVVSCSYPRFDPIALKSLHQYSYAISANHNLCSSRECENCGVKLLCTALHFVELRKEETMTRRRWFARDAAASLMGWWCLIVLAIGGCRGVLAVESAAMEPSAAVTGGEDGGCYRPLSDVIWGFLVTLLALTVSLWGSWKHKADDNGEGALAIVVGLFAPLEDLGRIIYLSLRCMSMLWRCHKMGNPDSRITSPSCLKFLCSSLFPWSKSPVRILASCDIVVYVSKESLLLQKRWLWKESIVSNESEAVVVGENGARAIRNDLYERKELSEEGIGLLVWKELFFKAEDPKCLPKYGELKHLRGKLGFAIIAIALQALGYIYAVAFRGARNLRISPIEVIGMVFNIILLIKVLFYSTCNPCHRPLVIYMDLDWEHEIDFDDNDKGKFEYYDLGKIQLVITFGIFIGLIILLICYIVNTAKATNVKVVLSIIAFLLGLSLGFLGSEIIKVDLNYDRGRVVHVTYVGFFVSVVAYIWAIVATIYYWKTMHFNTCGDLINFSQIIPFIG